MTEIKKLEEMFGERIAWLEKERRSGGNYEHMTARIEECQYVYKKARAHLEQLKTGGWRPIGLTEEWLDEIGFKWTQGERQPTKHWHLTLGWGAPNARACMEDLSIELASGAVFDEWFCWLRRGTKFSDNLIHVRHIKYQHEVEELITALTGTKWKPENSMYGNFYNDGMTAKMRPEYERIKSAPATPNEMEG